MPVVFLVFECRPERFGRAAIPTNPGRAHGPAQSVSETCLRGQVRGVLTSSIGMQNRATTPTAAGGNRAVDGLGDHLGTDVISDAIAEHFAGMSVPDRTQEHLTLTAR